MPSSGDVPTQRFWDIAAADFDGDHNLDVAAGSLESTVTLYLGNGDGTFAAPPMSIDFGAPAGTIAVGDFDKNGRPDTVIAQPDAQRVAVRLNFPGDGTACDDADACTHDDVYSAGVCVGVAVVCTAKDACHAAGTCDPTTGVCSDPAKPDPSPCSDGNPCTQSDTCAAGVGVGTSPVVCTAKDQCREAGTCNQATGTCSEPVKADGAPCSDGNACTQSDTCAAGVCVGASPVVCPLAVAECQVAGTCIIATGVCSEPVELDTPACTDTAGDLDSGCTVTPGASESPVLGPILFGLALLLLRVSRRVRAPGR